MSKQSINSERFKENIRKFKMMSNGNDCMIRSGFCTTHNVKMSREVMVKKMSNVDDRGNISWISKETTVLSCPMRNPSLALPRSVQPTSESAAMTSLLPRVRGTNQNRRKCTHDGKDQSTTNQEELGPVD